MKRKLKKLFRDPKLFFSDMLIKHRKKLDKLKPIKKYDGQNQFTVVSAVYGVEKYLDDYFKSLVNQRLDFKKHIQLILVDDGSLDNSAEVIKKWQKKYPDNITYLYKENGGQASARNLGLEHVKTKWVTFIDPDDFLDRDYFYSINKFLELSSDRYAFLGCNLFFYFEDLDQYKNTHPLNYKFKEKEPQIYSCSDLKKNIHMSSSSAIFSMEVIRQGKLHFNEKIKPSFEDASFISHYLFFAGASYKATFLSDPIYFYRKRSDNSSTLDSAWIDPKKYKDVFIYGYLPLLEFYEGKLGKVPLHIQRQVLYDLVWYVKYLLNADEKLNFLLEQEVTSFFDLFQKTISYIDDKTILDFELARIWFYHKVLILNGFKGTSGFKQISYIEKISKNKQELLISFIADEKPNVVFMNKGEDVLPISYKKIAQVFANQVLGYVHYYWLPFELDEGELSIKINGEISRINVSGSVFQKTVSGKVIQNSLSDSCDNYWILMDRDVQADDNAEHLYRYIVKNHPEQKVYFALRKTSHDWKRLNFEGFNLIEFGSSDYEKKLKNSEYIISSHADKYVHNYFPDNSLLKKSFIFLQHGITKDDMSDWFNTKKNLVMLVTASKQEYKSITSLDSNYIFTDREVKLVGFPRHDKLWINKEQESSKRLFVIMPTWRRSIVGQTIGDGNTREKNLNFEKTKYFQYWSSFLHSPHLKELMRKHKFKVIFAPHKNVELYLDSFQLPEYIQYWKPSNNESMQDLFLRSAFMITDYSSVAFEMAYLNKSTIYYQFDEDEVFSASTHIYKKGYYDYSREGFGPKVNTEEELLVELEKILNNDGIIENKYLERIKNTFAYQDADNCKRVYEAICDLDRPIDLQDLNIEILFDFAKKSVEHNDIPTAINRCEKLFELGDEKQKHWAYIQLLRLYYDDHKFIELDALLDRYFNFDLDESKRAQVRLLMLKNDFAQAVERLHSINHKNITDYFNLFKIAVENKNVELVHLYNSLIKKCPGYNTDYREIISLYFNYLNNDLDILVLRSKYIFSSVSKELIIQYKLELFIAKVYRQLGNYTEAHNSLVGHESHTKDDHECRAEIARLAFEERKYAKVVSQLQQAFDKSLQYMPYDLIYIYIKSTFLHKDYELSVLLIKEAKNLYGEDDHLLKKLELEFYIQLKDWEKISSFDQFICDNNLQEYVYDLLISYFKKGDYEKAYNLGVQIKNKELLSDIRYLSIMSDLSILVHDWSLAEDLLTQSLRFNENDIEIWNKLLHVQKMNIN